VVPRAVSSPRAKTEDLRTDHCPAVGARCRVREYQRDQSSPIGSVRSTVLTPAGDRGGAHRRITSDHRTSAPLDKSFHTSGTLESGAGLGSAKPASRWSRVEKTAGDRSGDPRYPPCSH
jgi:hypothetical protein